MGEQSLQYATDPERYEELWKNAVAKEPVKLEPVSLTQKPGVKPVKKPAIKPVKKAAPCGGARGRRGSKSAVRG